MSKSFYVTTPIYYVNDVPHIGHAYTTLAADTLARWHRLIGGPAYFLTGTDEHGLKIEQAARKSGSTPKEHVDRFSQPFRELCQIINVENDDFIRTTEERHQKVVQAMWCRMEEAGDIYLGEYAGWYSVSDEAYFTEEELVDGKAPNGNEVTWIVEKSYFFRLSKYTAPLLAHFRENPLFVQPQSRANEMIRFLEQGLKDISVSRTNFSWGIPVPNDKDHVIYVWVDALTNYVSALGGEGSEKYNTFWPNTHHIIGKDILRFHTIYWPAFLMSAGLPLPQQIFAHGWWTVEGEKMSKSKGNAIDAEATVKAVGSDALRYFLLREIPFGSDGDFSQAALLTRTNSDLGNDYGNLLNRTLGMIKRYRDAQLPPPVAYGEQGWGEHEEALYQIFSEVRIKLFQSMESFKFHEALQAIWRLVSAGNKYVDRSAPWVLARGGDQEAKHLDRVLYTLCELLRIIGVWTQPFLPQKSAQLLESLNVSDQWRSMSSTEEWGRWGELGEGARTLASKINLFPRVEGPLTITRAALAASTHALSSKDKDQDKKESEGQSKSLIEYDDFAKLEIKVAVVLNAESHPNADRLLKLTLDAGEAQPRTVCAGIAAAYKPEVLIGRRVALLANLKPRTLRGVVSQGMILAAGAGEGLCLIDVPAELPAGEIIS